MEAKSVQCMLLSGFLQHIYWASLDSLLVILHWYRPWPNITYSSSRCCGEDVVLPGWPSSITSWWLLPPRFDGGQVGLKTEENWYSSRLCVRQPARLSTSQHRQSSLRSSEEHLKSSRASSQQLSAEGTSAHDLRGAWPGVIQQGAEEESHLSSSSPPALFCLAPSLQGEVILCTVPSIPVCRHHRPGQHPVVSPGPILQLCTGKRRALFWPVLHAQLYGPVFLSSFIHLWLSHIYYAQPWYYSWLLRGAYAPWLSLGKTQIQVCKVSKDKPKLYQEAHSRRSYILHKFFIFLQRSQELMVFLSGAGVVLDGISNLNLP